MPAYIQDLPAEFQLPKHHFSNNMFFCTNGSGSVDRRAYRPNIPTSYLARELFSRHAPL